jgi:uncharacterized membrane protein YgcG
VAEIIETIFDSAPSSGSGDSDIFTGGGGDFGGGGADGSF